MLVAITVVVSMSSVGSVTRSPSSPITSSSLVVTAGSVSGVIGVVADTASSCFMISIFSICSIMALSSEESTILVRDFSVFCKSNEYDSKYVDNWKIMRYLPRPTFMICIFIELYYSQYSPFQFALFWEWWFLFL